MKKTTTFASLGLAILLGATMMSGCSSNSRAELTTVPAATPAVSFRASDGTVITTSGAPTSGATASAAATATSATPTQVTSTSSQNAPTLSVTTETGADNGESVSGAISSNAPAATAQPTQAAGTTQKLQATQHSTMKTSSSSGTGSTVKTAAAASSAPSATAAPSASSSSEPQASASSSGSMTNSTKVAASNTASSALSAKTGGRLEKLSASVLDQLKTATQNGSAKKVLKQGAKSNQVLALQNALAELNYMSGPTGYFGTITKKAVELFQAANSLKVDGIVGASTWDVLLSGSAIAA